MTTPEQVLRLANEAAGIPENAAHIPAPADAMDLAYRTALADVDAQEVGKAVAEEVKAGKDPESIDVEAKAEGSPATTKGSKK